MHLITHIETVLFVSEHPAVSIYPFSVYEETSECRADERRGLVLSPSAGIEFRKSLLP